MWSVGLLEWVMLNSNPISCEHVFGAQVLLSWFCASHCCWQTHRAGSLRLLTGCLSIRDENAPFGSVTFSYFVYRSQIVALNASFICTTVIFELPSDCQPSEGAKTRQGAFLSQKHRDELSGSRSVHQSEFAIKLVSQISYDFKNSG